MIPNLNNAPPRRSEMTVDERNRASFANTVRHKSAWLRQYEARR